MEKLKPLSLQFITPDIYAELGEFQRTGVLLDVDSATLMYVAQTEGQLVELTESLWAELENTDSYQIETDDWPLVAKLSVSVNRDYLDLKQKLATGQEVDAPIIVKYRDKYHLVAGNTRLMVARALGMSPKVLLFEVFDNETDY